MSEDQTKDATPALPSVADLTLGEGGSGGSVDGGAAEPGDRGPSSAASERVPAIVKDPPPAPPPPSAPPSSSEEGAEDASSAPAAADKSKNAGKELAAPKELTPEQRNKILTQVEFYFSDANLPTDAFLMKKVKSNPDGWVPLAVIVGFNRMKQLLKKNTHRVVAEILTEKSEALVVNDEGTHVRRANPLPTFDLEDVQSRTIVAENFSKNMGGGGGGGGDGPSIEAVQKLFAAAGKVLMVRVRHPGSQSPAGATAPSGLDLIVTPNSSVHALVEFSTAGEASKAVQLLNNDKAGAWAGAWREWGWMRGGSYHLFFIDFRPRHPCRCDEAPRGFVDYR